MKFENKLIGNYTKHFTVILKKNDYSKTISIITFQICPLLLVHIELII